MDDGASLGRPAEWRERITEASDVHPAGAKVGRIASWWRRQPGHAFTVDAAPPGECPQAWRCAAV